MSLFPLESASDFRRQFESHKTGCKLCKNSLTVTGNCAKCSRGLKWYVNNFIFRVVCPRCVADLTNIHSGLITYRNALAFFNLESEDIEGLPFAGFSRELAEYRTGDIILAAVAKHGCIESVANILYRNNIIANESEFIHKLEQEFSVPFEPFQQTQ